MIIDSLNQIPCWYILIGIIWSIYQGVRGAIEHRLNYEARFYNDSNQNNKIQKPMWKRWEKWVVLYVHDFVFRFICTISGFVALYLAYYLAGDKMQGITSGSSVLIVFLFLIGIIGVGGQLHYVILMGKLPK